MSSNIINLYATGTGGAEAMGMGASGTIIWLVIMIALFYFMLIRPQKKKEKADRQLRASLQPGDKIVTIGGFTGRILTGFEGDFVILDGQDTAGKTTDGNDLVAGLQAGAQLTVGLFLLLLRTDQHEVEQGHHDAQPDESAVSACGSAFAGSIQVKEIEVHNCLHVN